MASHQHGTSPDGLDWLGLADPDPLNWDRDGGTEGQDGRALLGGDPGATIPLVGDGRRIRGVVMFDCARRKETQTP